MKTVKLSENRTLFDTRFSDILTKFKAVKSVGFSEDEIRKSFTKDELVALLIWFDEQISNTEGVHQSDLFIDFEEL